MTNIASMCIHAPYAWLSIHSEVALKSFPCYVCICSYLLFVGIQQLQHCSVLAAN